MPFSVRAAREADLERLVDIHADAFPDGRGRDVRRRHLGPDGARALADALFALPAYFSRDAF